MKACNYPTIMLICVLGGVLVFFLTPVSMLITSAVFAGDIEIPPAERPPLRLCTASRSGNYYWTGEVLARNAAKAVNIELIVTEGSMENLERMLSGRCDAAFVQRDAYLVYADANPGANFDFERVFSPYKEYVHMLCNRYREINGVGDLNENHVLLIGAEGSGTAVTWANFVAEDTAYAAIKTEHVGVEQALDKIIKGERDCMLFVSGLNTGPIRQAESSKRVKLVPVNDWDFNDVLDPTGTAVYQFDEIPNDLYANLQEGWLSTAVETLTVAMDMIVANTWINKHSRPYRAFVQASLRSQDEIRRHVGQQ